MPSSRSPKVVKAALARIGADGEPAETFVFQYNPTKLFRRIEKRSEGRGALPTEIIRCTLVLDATDALEHPEQNPETVEHGIQPQLAALELLMHPARLSRRRWIPFRRRGAGSTAAPLALFIWGASRILPVRLERLDVLEVLHDPSLRPIRATVKVSMRVVTHEDVPRSHPAAEVWRRYEKRMRQLAESAYAGPSA